MTKSLCGRIVILCLACLAVFLILGTRGAYGADYGYYFRPITEAWLAGETRLFDDVSQGWYMAPWALLLFLPTLLLQPAYGQAALIVFSLLGMVLAIRVLAHRPGTASVLLAMVNLHTVDLVLIGNIDGLLALGVALGWIGASVNSALVLGAGLWLLSVKPVNVILVALLLLKMVPWRTRLLALIPTAASAMGSFGLSGLDWPIRYFQHMAACPPLTVPQTTLWRIMASLGYTRECGVTVSLLFLAIAAWYLWHMPVDAHTIMLALAAQLTFAPYAISKHYVLVAPALAHLGWRYWPLTLTPLLRLAFGWDVVWVDWFYPAALLWGLCRRQS